MGIVHSVRSDLSLMLRIGDNERGQEQPLGLILESLSVAYDKSRVVNQLDLVVNQGEFVVLLGASGSGKTTILRAVAGFVEISNGTITANGFRIDKLPVERRNVGVVFQDYALFPHMTVRQNIDFGLRIRKVPNQEKSRLVDEMLDLVDLRRYADVKPNLLSGGQKQRVALARALVYTPSVLLMDEPLSALDRKLRGGLQEEIRRIVRKAGITTLYVTHDQEEAFNLADRVAILQNGRLTQVANPTELYDNPSCLYNAWFVGEANSLPIRIDKISEHSVEGGFVTKEGKQVCRVVGKKGQDLLDSDRAAIAVIRPESVHLTFDKSNSSVGNSFFDAAHFPALEGEFFAESGIDTTGRIVDVRELGSDVRYEIDVNGARLKSRMIRRSAEDLARPGDEVRVMIPLQAILVLPDTDPDNATSA